jgi:Homing endonuclease associated repeat
MREVYEKPVCRKCSGLKTSKAGISKGKQRFYCRECRVFFIENPIRSEGMRIYDVKTDILPSKRRLILELHVIAQSLGKTPTTEDIARLSKKKKCHSLNTYYAVFDGSYVTAVKEAKLKSHYRQEFDKEKLICELQFLSKKLKRPLFGKDVNEARRKGLVSSPYHFQRAFGSIPNAIQAAEGNKKHYFRNELINHLKKLKTELGRIPRGNDVKANYKQGERPSLKAFLNEFGSISNARKAAGIANPQWKKFTKTELIQQLKDLGEKLGRKPTDRDIIASCKKGEMASQTLFVREFGSLIKAYEAAGFEVLKPQQYTDAELIKRLRELRKKLGKRIGWNDLDRASKEGYFPTGGTVYRRIGNMDKVEEILNE